MVFVFLTSPDNLYFHPCCCHLALFHSFYGCVVFHCVYEEVGSFITQKNERVHTEAMGALHHRFNRAWLSPAPQSPPQSLPAARGGLTGWTVAQDAACLAAVACGRLATLHGGPDLLPTSCPDSGSSWDTSDGRVDATSSRKPLPSLCLGPLTGDRPVALCMVSSLSEP